MADEIDEATLGLMIELQLQDAQSLTKGKNRSSEILQDSELAGWLFEQELQALESFRVAQAMSRSIAHALSTDDAAIKTLTFREEQAHRDREYAIHGQDSVNYPVPASTSTPVPPIEDRTTVEKPVPSYMNESRPPSAAEPSSTQSARAGPSVQAVREPEMRNCVACMSDAPVHWCTRCPCSHDYCRECLTTLFENAISDESLFPPKCCKEPIPISLTTSILPWTLVEAFNAKEKEFGTANRTYCHTPTCSAFIPEQSIWEDVATCIKCGSRTCAICKRESHHGDCPDDSATAELLRTAAAQGWQRCYSCHRVVDLKAGCNHITCRCGAQFCYVCGARWKECTCDVVDPTRLFDHDENANQDAGRQQIQPAQPYITMGPQRRANRDAGRQQIQPAQPYITMGPQRGRFGTDHGCRHAWFDRLRGMRFCDMCRGNELQSISECDRCGIWVCDRCRVARRF